MLPPWQEASDENVVATATAQGIGWFAILSLAEFGQLSLQPSTSGSAEPAAVAMATDPPKDPHPPLPESPVVEDDHTMLTPANMVE